MRIFRSHLAVRREAQPDLVLAFTRTDIDSLLPMIALLVNRSIEFTAALKKFEIVDFDFVLHR